MKRFFALLTAAALLTGCAAKKTEDRAGKLQGKYAAMQGCEARVEETIVSGGESRRCTVAISRTEGETRVTVLEPEALAGVTASVRADEGMKLEYDGMVLDAGEGCGGVCAANAVSVFLRAAAEGFVVEQSRERCEDRGETLRLCFETEPMGEKLLVAAFFDEQDAPIYAEIEKDGEILAYLQFTDFAFGDILSDTAAETAGESEAPFYGLTTAADLG